MHNSAQFRADDNEVGVNAKLKGAKTGRFKPPPWPEFLGPFIAGAALPQEGTDKATDQPHLDQIATVKLVSISATSCTSPVLMSVKPSVPATTTKSLIPTSLLNVSQAPHLQSTWRKPARTPPPESEDDCERLNLPRYSAVVSNGVKHNTELARKSKTLAHRSKFTSATPLTSDRPTKRVGNQVPTVYCTTCRATRRSNERGSATLTDAQDAAGS